MPIFKVKGYPYHYEKSGEGKPNWVFLHGFMGSSADFESIKPKGTSLYLDLLGFGESAIPVADASRFNVTEQVDDLHQLMKVLFDGPVNLVGYSMGARLALAYAKAYPQDLLHVVLEGGTPGLADLQQRQARQQADELKAKRVLTQGMAPFIADWEKLPLFASQQHVSPKQQAFMHAQRMAQHPQNVAASLREFGTGRMPDFWPDLKHIQVETVLINGGLDQKFLAISEQMLLQLPHAQQVVVPEVGHNVHFEQPLRYTEVLNEI